MQITPKFFWFKNNHSWIRGVFSFLILVWFFLFVPSPAYNEIGLEYKIKTAFTLNFLKFVEWPSGKKAEGINEEIILSVLGDGEINEALKLIEGQIVNEKKISIRFINSISEIKSSDALFINTSKSKKLETIIKKLNETPILTISDIEGFCENGGMINIVIIDDSIDFEVNLEATQRSNISLSYKLLKQAHKVYKPKV